MGVRARPAISPGRSHGDPASTTDLHADTDADAYQVVVAKCDANSAAHSNGDVWTNGRSADADQHIDPGDADQHIDPGDADQHINPVDADQHNGASGSDSDDRPVSWADGDNRTVNRDDCAYLCAAHRDNGGDYCTANGDVGAPGTKRHARRIPSVPCGDCDPETQVHGYARSRGHGSAYVRALSAVPSGALARLTPHGRMRN